MHQQLLRDHKARSDLRPRYWICPNRNCHPYLRVGQPCCARWYNTQWMCVVYWLRLLWEIIICGPSIMRPSCYLPTEGDAPPWYFNYWPLTLTQLIICPGILERLYTWDRPDLVSLTHPRRLAAFNPLPPTRIVYSRTNNIVWMMATLGRDERQEYNTDDRTLAGGWLSIFRSYFVFRIATKTWDKPALYPQ